MSGRNLPQRPQPTTGPDHGLRESNPGEILGLARALVLIQETEQTLRLQGVLSSIGIDVCEARSASGAAAVLRREEARGRSFDFLLVDGLFGGICGMSLCAALCMQLRRRPEVILLTPTENLFHDDALIRSGISAVVDPECTLVELQTLLLGLHRQAHHHLPEHLAPAGRVTF